MAGQTRHERYFMTPEAAGWVVGLYQKLCPDACKPENLQKDAKRGWTVFNGAYLTGGNNGSGTRFRARLEMREREITDKKTGQTITRKFTELIRPSIELVAPSSYWEQKHGTGASAGATTGSGGNSESDDLWAGMS